MRGIVGTNIAWMRTVSFEQNSTVSIEIFCIQVRNPQHVPRENMKKKIINVPTASAVFLRMRLITTSAAMVIFARPLNYLGEGNKVVLVFKVELSKCPWQHIELALPGTKYLNFVAETILQVIFSHDRSKIGLFLVVIRPNNYSK